MGGRGRDGRRNTREAHPDSSAASGELEGSSTVSPRAVPAKPPGVRALPGSRINFWRNPIIFIFPAVGEMRCAQESGRTALSGLLSSPAPASLSWVVKS